MLGVRQVTGPGRWASFLVPLPLCAVLQDRVKKETMRRAWVEGTGKVTVMAGFSVGVWLVTFWRSGFRSDCYLSRHSSETSDGVATSVKNVRPLLSWL